MRICRIGGFGFNVTNYPILAFKVKFPENVFETSTSMEWYLDIWGGSGITDVYKRQILGSSIPQPGLPVSTIDGKPYAWGGIHTPNWSAELGGDNQLVVTAVSYTHRCV